MRGFLVRRLLAAGPTVLAVSLVGQGLNDALNPRLKSR